jgi:hypothetical protein
MQTVPQGNGMLKNRVIEKMKELGIMAKTEVTITESKDSCFTFARIEGPTEQVDQCVEQYFRDYNPLGYMTMIISERQDENGKFVKIRRASSCD